MITRLTATGGDLVAMFRKNPVIWAAAIRIVMALFSRIGLDIHGELLAILGVTLTILVAIVVQATVTPNVRLKSPAENNTADKNP